MATTDIVPDGDLSPLQFQLVGAATHTAALNSATNDLKELQGQQAGLTVHISLSTPSPTITEATNVRFKLWMRYTLNISASTFGYRLELYKNNGADLLGIKSQLFSSTGTPYEVIFDVPCSFGEADKSSLSFKIVTYGTGWGSFQAITAIEACTLVRVTYTAASPPPLLTLAGRRPQEQRTLMWISQTYLPIPQQAGVGTLGIAWGHRQAKTHLTHIPQRAYMM